MNKVLIIGATSKIAHETAKLFAATNARLFLAGRSEEKLSAIGDDLAARGAQQTEIFVTDLANVEQHPELIETAIEKLDGLDTVLIAHGTLGDQEACQQNAEETLAQLQTNCISVISLLTIIANYFEQKRCGCITVITSVAGDRGRKSNYVYGTAKGALHVFLQGLRNRLHGTSIKVVTIKAGFVDTPMTEALPKNTLFAQPVTVGRGVYNAIKKGSNVVYLPWFWRPIMLVIRMIPEPVFKRMNL